MNKKMIKKAQKLSINTGRLYDNQEQYPIEWLLKKKHICTGHESNLDMIKDAILCMNKNHSNYRDLSEEDKLKVEKLKQHDDVVDIVLLTTFQWFGTNVGKSDIGKLLDEIRKFKYEKQELK